MEDKFLFEASEQREIADALVAFKQELTDFLDGRLPNLYVHGNDVVSVYTRKGVHCVNGELANCLDIASISVSENMRNRGVGTSVINHMHRVNPYPITFVESLLNAELYARLLADGWKDVEGSNPPSVYKAKHG